MIELIFKNNYKKKLITNLIYLVSILSCSEYSNPSKYNSQYKDSSIIEMKSEKSNSGPFIISKDQKIKKKNENSPISINKNSNQDLKSNLLLKKELITKNIKSNKNYININSNLIEIDKIKENTNNNLLKVKKKKQKLKPENIAIILIQGLGAPKESMYWMRNKLKKYGQILINCREKCDHLSISSQAKVIEASLLRILKNPKIKKIFIIGHSLGGNLGMKALANIADQIKNKSIIFEIFTIGAPFLGSKFAKLNPNFLEFLGMKTSHIAFKQLKNIQKRTENIKKDLETIYKVLKENVKITVISTKSKFMKGLNETLRQKKKILKLFCNNKKLASILKNKIPSFIFKLSNKQLRKLYIDLDKLGKIDNDGAITIESQKGRDIFPKGIKVKIMKSLNNISHTRFSKYTTDEIILNYIKSEVPQVESYKILNLIIKAIINNT